MNGGIATSRIVSTGDLIGSGETAALLSIDKSTLVRKIAAGKIQPLTRLDGPRGAFVFDRTDIEALAEGDAK